MTERKDNNNDDRFMVVQIDDYGSYYSIYGIVCMIVVLLLLWSFVRSSLMNDGESTHASWSGCGSSRSNNYYDGFVTSATGTIGPNNDFNAGDADSAASDNLYDMFKGGAPNRLNFVSSADTANTADIADNMDTNGIDVSDGDMSDGDIRSAETRSDSMVELVPSGIANGYQDMIALQAATERPIQIPLTDSKYKGKLLHGIYGDVPVYLYDDKQDTESSQWRQPGKSVYLPNSKASWKTANYAIEMPEWSRDEGYVFPYF